MNIQTNIELLRRKQFLERIIAEKTKALQDAPNGILRVHHHGKYIQYYCRKDSKDPAGKYIKNKDRGFAAALAQKDYDKRILKLAENELSIIQSLLMIYEKEQIESVYENLQVPRQDLIQPVIATDKQYVDSWLNVNYKKKPFYDDAPEFFTSKGERVRSKSEIIIADTLGRMNVPYRYECPLKLKGFGTVYPDFTVLNVRLRRAFLWEHFGMMDDQEYSQKALTKIESYEKNGYFPGSHLILTHETSLHPIGTKVIEKMISHYLK
ncbi:MAG: hypothetical protein IJ137_08170 [Eubacterium sp.]|nr:hypothetical protein [Eubacterium sp.]